MIRNAFLIATAAVVAGSVIGFAQVASKVSGFVPPPGQYVISPHSAEPVGSLDDLIKRSQVIVDGSVIDVLPSVNRNPDLLGEVETAAIISINSVIKGKAPARGQILLVEAGGKQGKWSVTVKGNPGVQPGERYILFLGQDTRQSIPNASVLPDPNTTPRYYGLDYANGKARIDSYGLVQFAAGAPILGAQFGGQALASFLVQLNARIAKLFPSPPSYPFGVTPLTPPDSSIFPKPAGSN
jgi:hypothetical protein